jgi:hypothetical protein
MPIQVRVLKSFLYPLTLFSTMKTDLSPFSFFSFLYLSGEKPSADRPCTQERWDAWGEMVQPLFSTQAGMFLPGNHEPENPGNKDYANFLAFQSRFRMPSMASGATEGNLYYSFEVASAHFIFLNSYDTDYSTSSKQYKWLQQDLSRINRGITPWVLVSLHAPWYNSNAVCLSNHPTCLIFFLFWFSSSSIYIYLYIYIYTHMYVRYLCVCCFRRTKASQRANK